MSVGAIIEAQVRAVGTKAASAELVGFGRTASAVGKQVDKGLGASLARGLAKTGAAANSAGKVITKSLGIPLAAAGAVAIKLALDFDTAFARIGALAGKLGVSVDEAKKHVLALAGETAQSPQELANALYFVASAGLKASQVMPVLDAAAKAAAAGMGDAATIAQTLTSVVNAYAGTGLTAARATNIMTEAVKVGKAEATDFATGLGPVIGVAAQAGVSFNDLAAAIAQATNLGLPFDRAVTAARFVIQSLESPTAKAKSALHDYGFEVAEIHSLLSKPGGLQHVLQTLADTFDLSTAKGREAWAAVTGGARGAVLAVDLVGKHTEAANGILSKLDDSAKAGAHTFDVAYSKATNTAAFRTEQLMRKLQATGIVLGEKLLPFVDKAVQFVTKLADKFTSLTDAQQENVLKWAGIAVAAGPVLRIFGSLTTAGAGVVGMFSRLGSGISSMGGPLSTLLPSLGPVVGLLGPVGLAGAILLVGSTVITHGKNILDFMKGLNEQSTGLAATSKSSGFWTSLGQFFGDARDFVKQGIGADLATKGDKIRGLIIAILDATQQSQINAATDSLKGYQKQGFNVSLILKQMADAGTLTAAQVKKIRAEMGLGLNAGANYGHMVSAVRDDLKSLAGQIGRSTTLTQGQKNALGGLLAKLSLEHGSLSTTQRRYLDAYIAAGDFKDAQILLDKAVERATRRIDKQNAKVHESHKPIHTAIGDYDKLTGAIKRVPTDVGSRMSITGLRKAYADAGDWEAYLRSFPRTIETRFAVKGKPGEVTFQHGGMVGGVGSGDIVPAMLEPGELVVPKSVVKRWGAEHLQTSLGMVHAMKEGGTVPAPAGVQFRDLVVTQAKASPRDIMRALDWEARKMAHR